MKSNLKIVLIYVVLIGVIILATASLWNTIPSEEILYSDIRAYFVKSRSSHSSSRTQLSRWKYVKRTKAEI